MREIICDNCGNVIKRKESKIGRAKKHYCSKDCRYHAQCKAKRLPMIIDGYIHLEVTRGKTTIFDIEDRDLAEYNWQSHKEYVNRKGPDNKYIFMHREIMKRKLKRLLSDDEEVDHINGNRLDNRRDNLRSVIHSRNCLNIRKTNKESTSKYKGVSLDKSRNKWRARITISGMNHQLGYFEDEREAAKAYDKAAIYYFGDNAKLNFEKEKYAWEIHEQAGSAIRAKA
jgi:hypothetical protein